MNVTITQTCKLFLDPLSGGRWIYRPGEGLSVGDLFATEMACPEPAGVLGQEGEGGGQQQGRQGVDAAGMGQIEQLQGQGQRGRIDEITLNRRDFQHLPLALCQVVAGRRRLGGGLGQGQSRFG